MKKLLLILGILFTVSAQASDCVVIVLDTSGSMAERMRGSGQSRIEVAQNALISVLSKIPDTTKVGIVTFDGWICDLAPINRSQISEQILATRGGGGTPLYEFLRDGANRLLEEREREANIGSYKLVAITDGEASDEDLNEESVFSDGTARPGVLQDIISRNIVVDAIGLDMGEDHSLKTAINGIYMRGDDPNTLIQAVSKAVAEVGFGDQRDVAEESFSDIADLPLEFCQSTIIGLTTFSNHQIGQKPPIPSVDPDGTIRYAPDPNPEPEPESGISRLGIMGIFLLVACFLIFIFCLIAASEG